MSHRAIVLNVSAIYIGLIAMLRLTVDATSETQRSVTRMVERANELYERLLSEKNEPRQLQYAAMTLAVYDMILDTDGISRVTVDRIAQCDVHRRRRRLQRTIETLLVPTQDTVPSASVSMMARSSA